MRKRKLCPRLSKTNIEIEKRGMDLKAQSAAL
jgi:hypothetical protein